MWATSGQSCELVDLVVLHMEVGAQCLQSLLFERYKPSEKESSYCGFVNVRWGKTRPVPGTRQPVQRAVAKLAGSTLPQGM